MNDNKINENMKQTHTTTNPVKKVTILDPYYSHYLLVLYIVYKRRLNQ